MHNFKQLKVWQKARYLVKDIYLLSLKLPSDERFGLSSQIKRSAVSIASNIAEGSGRNTNKDFARFLAIALSSAYELETQIILATDLSLVAKKEIITIYSSLDEIQKMIYTLIIKFK